jgi:alpha-D-xyloside xylohydrolase
MRKKGFRISFWQWPYIQGDTAAGQTAVANGYVGTRTNALESKECPMGKAVLCIDLTNPAAVEWYQGLLRHVLDQGASVIKVDFGEWADEQAAYKGTTGAKYRNLHALLYQRAVWEITKQTKGEGIIWARSGWAGSQRYPVHWSGDCFCTYEGLHSCLCGGFHLGLSGFAFWSHDVGGFTGLPDILGVRPTNELYLRWTQVGTFSSHMRYHGTTPREPWEFPTVCDIVREWLRFRYALLPYIISRSAKCCESGLPFVQALVIEWADDPVAWTISDEYLFGEAFLICPVLNSTGMRDVYLPEGTWVDFWTGEVLAGPRWIRKIRSPLSRIPLYARFNATIQFAEPVQCTDQLPQAKRVSMAFDETYRGFAGCELAEFISI